MRHVVSVCALAVVGCGSEPLIQQRITLPPVDENDGADGAPVDEEPVDEEPVDEEPVDEEPVDEEPVDEEPVDEEPVDEEPVDEEPVDPRLPVQPTVACGPGAVVEMTYLITSNDMRGASATGEGRCFGTVKFADDLAPQGEWRQFHYADDGSSFFEEPRDYNGSSRLVTPDCGSPHCAEVGYADGNVRSDYCTIIAVCEDGVGRAIGFTW